MVGDYRFEVDAGRTVVDGDDVWPDTLALAVPRAEVLSTAMNLLRWLEQPPRPEADGVMLMLQGRLVKVS